MSRMESFLQSVPLPGLRYVFEGKTWLERIIWIVAISTCLLFVFLFALASISEAENNPMSTSMETVPIQVKKLFKKPHES